MTCLNNTAVPGCYASPAGPVCVIIHTVYDNEGAPKVVITDTASVPIPLATAANTCSGSCASTPNDVEWLTMCDVQADGSIVRFEQRTITSWDSLNVATSVTASFEADRTTVYVPTGTVGECDTCQPLTAAQRGVQAAW